MIKRFYFPYHGSFQKTYVKLGPTNYSNHIRGYTLKKHYVIVRIK